MAHLTESRSRRVGRHAVVLATVVTLGFSALAGASPAPALAMSGSLLVTRLHGVGDATQVISVTADHAGADRATLQAFTKDSHGWRRTSGPWSAWVGRSGFAPAGAKREGDGRTPTGSYRLSYFFGAVAEPSGIHYRWRHARSTSFWDDDSASPRYNEWVDSRRHQPGRAPEPLAVPSYDAAAAIAFNPARVPGRGSAIFLHITHDSATSGCVALPRAELLRLLRWLRPSDHPRIIMGTTASVT